jgi:hypothetical protein
LDKLMSYDDYLADQKIQEQRAKMYGQEVWRTSDLSSTNLSPALSKGEGEGF